MPVINVKKGNAEVKGTPVSVNKTEDYLAVKMTKTGNVKVLHKVPAQKLIDAKKATLQKDYDFTVGRNPNVTVKEVEPTK